MAHMTQLMLFELAREGTEPGSLEFESAELDLLSLDFADVKQLRSA